VTQAEKDLRVYPSCAVAKTLDCYLKNGFMSDFMHTYLIIKRKFTISQMGNLGKVTNLSKPPFSY
jgi:hypothetical protein